MEDNRFNVSRIYDLDESARMLLDYYQDDDNVDVYIYCLIAAIVKQYVMGNSNKTSKKYDMLVLSLIINSDKHDEIHMKTKKLKELFGLIDKYKVSELLYNVLLLKFILNEKEININYKRNLHNTKEDELDILNNEYYELKMKKEENSKYIVDLYNDYKKITKFDSVINYDYDSDEDKIYNNLEDDITINNPPKRYK